MVPTFTLETLESRQLLASAVLSGGVLSIVGDAKVRNQIVIATGTSGLTVDVSFNGIASQTFPISDIQSITATGAGKTDKITVDETNGAIARPITLYGKNGNDTLTADISPATLVGGDQNDILYGGAGDDILNAGAGSDIVYGGDGDDLLRGSSNDDTLLGENGNDSLYGEAGDDYLNGGDGNDYLDAASGDDVLADVYNASTFNNFRGGKGDDIFYISPGDHIQDDQWWEWVYVAGFDGHHHHHWHD